MAMLEICLSHYIAFNDIGPFWLDAHGSNIQNNWGWNKYVNYIHSYQIQFNEENEMK